MWYAGRNDRNGISWFSTVLYTFTSGKMLLNKYPWSYPQGFLYPSYPSKPLPQPLKTPTLDQG